jgi:hypothetical protein
MHSLRILLALTIVMSGESAVSIVNSCGNMMVPRKDDGTDFGCVLIQSYGLIAALGFLANLETVRNERSILLLSN